MAIQLPQGFDIRSREPIDVRFVLTKQQMIDQKEALMPEVYLCLCSTDKRLYLYDKNATWNSETGKYRLVDAQVLSNTTLFETALSNSTKFTTLETKVGDAEHGLVKDVTKIQGDVTVLQTNVSTLQTNVTKLRTDVDTLTPEVEKLKEEVEDPESGLAKRIAALELRLDSAEERMEEIEEWMRTIKLDNISGTLNGGEIQAKFNITGTLINVDGPSTSDIEYLGTKTLTFTAKSGYTLPIAISVNTIPVSNSVVDCGVCSAQWAQSTGTLILAQAKDNITFKITAGA